jgi:hypothetical protein
VENAASVDDDVKTMGILCMNLPSLVEITPIKC